MKFLMIASFLSLVSFAETKKIGDFPGTFISANFEKLDRDVVIKVAYNHDCETSDASDGSFSTPCISRINSADFELSSAKTAIVNTKSGQIDCGRVETMFRKPMLSENCRFVKTDIKECTTYSYRVGQETETREICENVGFRLELVVQESANH